MDERRRTEGSGISRTGDGERPRKKKVAGSQPSPERRRKRPAGTETEARRRTVQPAPGERPRRRPVSSGDSTTGSANNTAKTGQPTGQPVKRRPASTGESVKRRPAQRPPSRPRKKKRGAAGIIVKVLILVILIVGALGGALLWTKYGPSKEQFDLDKYFAITSDTQMGLTVNDEVLDGQAMTDSGTVYVAYEVVRDYLNERFYWDANENILLYTLPTDMVKVDLGSKDYSTSASTNSEDYVILKTEGSTAYIALDFVQKYTNLDYKAYDNPSRVMIVSEWGEISTAVVKRDTQVRLKGGVKSPILTEVEKGDKLTVIEDESDWKKVRTEDGYIGYVQKSKLRKIQKETTQREFAEDEFTSIHKDYTINMAWHQVTSQSANSRVLETLASTKGLTTISPTWFTVADNSGNITSIASSDYTNYAHQMGIEVWALVDNFGEGIDQTELLSHTSVRVNMENQLIAEALQNGIDGINIDFEQIPQEAGEHYIQFIREMSVKCRLNNLVLSVDNYVPKGYNAHYHTKEQGIVADYIIIMGYDEHYSGSYEAGSVASYGYVKDGIEELLKQVPAEKVINAVPFYTRLWKETEKTEDELAEQQGTEAAEYPMKVTSEALGMAEAAQRVNAAGAEITWDDTAKQNYAQWSSDDGSTYKIWLEDASSLEAKLQLMKDNKLAGVSAWKLGFETSDIWELIIKYVN